MGWKPREIEDHTLWELIAFIDGHNRAQGGEKGPEPMSNDEFDQLLEAHKIG